MRLIGKLERVAKLQHQCTWCGEFIIPTERYVRMVFVFEGELDINKFHLECKAAADAECDDEYGFVPYEHDRPPVGIGHGIH